MENNKVFTTIGVSRVEGHQREENDFYATDPIAIDKLLTVEKPYSIIWECACGMGHLSKRLVENGYLVLSTDLFNRGYEGQQKQIDFLKSEKPSFECDILTNPPYKYATEFVLKALNLIEKGRKVYMFLKLTFLEGKTRYKEIFSKTPPKNVYVFCERILCARGWELSKKFHSAVCYAWFVWEKGYEGKTEVSWI